MVFDKPLLGSNEKAIKKMYDYLFETKMQDQMVKECMIRQAQNIGHNVDIDHWMLIWKNNIKLTKWVNLKENIYKMFYRQYMTPKKL